MAEKKSSTILLTVIGIATLLVTLVGATYAYFTASFTETEDADDTDVVIEAAELGSIVFEHGETLTLSNVYPGTSESVEFTVRPDADATVDVAYEVWMDVTANTFTDNLRAALSGPEGETHNLTVGTAVDKATGTLLDQATYGENAKVKIAEGVIKPGEADTWTLTVGFVEADADQNADQSATFTAGLRVEAAAEYTQQSVYRSGN